LIFWNTTKLWGQKILDKRQYYRDTKVTDTYDKVRFGTPSGQWTHRMELGIIKRVFSPQENILDVACGTGRLLKELRSEGWQLTGIDQSESMLQAGSLKGEPNIFVGDVFKMPFENNSMDGAYCFRFTNHYSDLDPFFRESHRILKKGGHLVFDTMRWSPLFWDFSSLGGRNYLIRDGKIRKFLHEVGFEVEEVQSLFLIPPFILGKIPLFLTKLILFMTVLVPKSLHAVAAWHVRKIH